MANRTNSSEYFWSYEYYWDYIDPIPVDGSKLKVNKYSVVIAFWVGLAAFVTFLFLILLYMSRSGSTPVKSSRDGSLQPRYRASHSKVSSFLFKNPAKEPSLRAGVKVPSGGGKGESPHISHSSRFCCWSYSISRKVIVGNQTEESSSNGEQPHCDDLSSPYSDAVASQTPTSLSDETGIHGRI